MNPHEKIKDKQSTREIIYPILDAVELDEQHIKALEIPEEIQVQLKAWERVVDIKKPPVVLPEHPRSAQKALMRLTGASNLKDVGANRPSLASIASEANQDLEALTKYEEVHGRDALQVAVDLYPFYPQLLATTIIALAEQQGVDDEEYIEGTPFRQEEKGRIMLLNRGIDDELGRRLSKEKGWGWPFYGSIDATPSFVNAIALYTKDHPEFLYKDYTARDGSTRKIRDAFISAVEWQVKKTAENPEGLLEFKNKTPKGGMLNQAWKDWAGAYVHADGEWANHHQGIASIEVQGLAYDAYLNAGKIYRDIFKDPVAARGLEQRAADLRREVFAKFWVEDERGGYFVLGTDRDEDGNLRQMKVRTSNMGRLFNGSILKGDDPETVYKRDAALRTLFSAELLSPHGIRTLSNLEQAFRKKGYQVGAVWDSDNAVIAAGLEEHGYYGLAWHIRKCILKNAEQTKTFPEFVQGDDEPIAKLNGMQIYVEDTKHNETYLWEQLPQEIQAWVVSAVLVAKYKHGWPKEAVDAKLRRQELEFLPQTV